MKTMDAENRHRIEHHCRRLVLEVARRNDGPEPAAAAELFTPDALLYHPLAPDVPLRGRAAIAAALARRPAGVLTHHVVSNVVVDVDGDKCARALSYYTVYLQPGGVQRYQPFSFDGTVYVGTYDDRFRLTADGWRIVERIGRHRFVLPFSPTEASR